MDALEELINAGPEPGYRVKAVILQRYADILKARQLMRKWQDITVALGFEARQWRQIAGVFRRVDAGVKAGKLMPGKSAVTNTKVVQQNVTPSVTPSSPPPAKRPLPGQQIPVGDGDAMNAELAAKGINWR